MTKEQASEWLHNAIKESRFYDGTDLDTLLVEKVVRAYFGTDAELYIKQGEEEGMEEIDFISIDRDFRIQNPELF